ncbi:hypothetical protein [Nannocystis pusilla]|uniref:hypothetical protein n=1 Tax=Nannocystis pusilla TaxID=889268 RepID=UPI003B796187
MGSDREHERRVRLARGVLAWLTACGGLLIAAEAARLPSRHAWQHLAGLALALVFVGACGLGLRRARVDPGRALELAYVTVLVALAGNGLLVALPLLVLACAAAFLILATAPRVVAPARVDLWTAVAVFAALALGALELAPLPTRVADTDGGPLRDLACVGALIVAGVLAVRDFSRYPLKIKLTLVTLLVALAPLFVVRVDAHLRLGASDLEAALGHVRSGSPLRERVGRLPRRTAGRAARPRRRRRGPGRLRRRCRTTRGADAAAAKHDRALRLAGPRRRAVGRRRPAHARGRRVPARRSAARRARVRGRRRGPRRPRAVGARRRRVRPRRRPATRPRARVERRARRHQRRSGLARPRGPAALRPGRPRRRSARLRRSPAGRRRRPGVAAAAPRHTGHRGRAPERRPHHWGRADRWRRLDPRARA